ncbi:MAG TPA: nucleoside triphosphate pyrophosphohydrolase [Caulifigura sp.]|nr:nucleoside triphosphate pyrophosphohydrolase [Caulifigura sp.]
MNELTKPTPGTPPDATRLASFGQFCEVIAKLRSPTGCPWDREQTLETIKPFTLEETYELLEAIDSGDDRAICEELGDVLLQVVLDSQIAADEGRFDVIAVIEGITQKMIERHPHVFGDAEAETPADVKRQWEKIKAAKQPRESVLDGIPVALPTLARALRITKKAARVGYDFPHRDMLFDKLREEIDELLVELYPQGDRPTLAASVDGPVVADEPIRDPERKARVESEIGDILFVIANIARRWGIDPEEALRSSNEKFSRRFRAIERGLKEASRPIEQATLAEMEELYQAEKARAKREASNERGR